MLTLFIYRYNFEPQKTVLNFYQRLHYTVATLHVGNAEKALTQWNLSNKYAVNEVWRGGNLLVKQY